MTRPDPSVLDVFFRSLANSRRRAVLSHLLEGTDDSATVAQLVDGVAGAEANSSSPDRGSIEVSLEHDHLPMLVERGLIEYDRGQGVVTTTGRTEQIRPYLGVVQDVTERAVVANPGPKPP